MVTERVAKELRSALETMRGERDQLSRQISAMESLLTQMGAPLRRGPGRPKGSVAKPAAPSANGVFKRGPGRPRKDQSAAATQGKSASSKSGQASLQLGDAPKRRGPGRPKGSKNKVAKRGPGRPPKSASKSRRAPKWSPQAREAARERMRAYWAARNKNAN